MSRTPIAMWDTPLVTIAIPSFALLFATGAVHKSSYRSDPAGMGHNLNNSTLDGKCYAACGRAYTESSTGNGARFCSHANTKSNSSSMLWQR